MLFGLNYKFGLGHMVIGGAVVFGDVEKKLGFSYFNNQQHKDLRLYETANKLSKALYSIL